MTRDELVARLNREGIRPDAYDLEKTQKDEVYCLERVFSGWVVYYRERGIHRDESIFSSENDACLFFLDLVLRDPTTREIDEE